MMTVRYGGTLSRLHSYVCTITLKKTSLRIYCQRTFNLSIVSYCTSLFLPSCLHYVGCIVHSFRMLRRNIIEYLINRLQYFSFYCGCCHRLTYILQVGLKVLSKNVRREKIYRIILMLYIYMGIYETLLFQWKIEDGVSDTIIYIIICQLTRNVT